MTPTPEQRDAFAAFLFYGSVLLAVFSVLALVGEGITKLMDRRRGGRR